MRNPHGHKGYGPDAWGLTACDDPAGYAAHSPAHDNGVIAPTAALSSFPYAPEQAMRALRHFHDDLGAKIWGRFGFVDAFSEPMAGARKAISPSTRGRSSAMIENYRSGLLWSLFMRDPDVRRGLARLGFRSPPHRRLRCQPTRKPQARISLAGWRANMRSPQKPCSAPFPEPISSRSATASAAVVRPAKGSILASPVLAAYDPDPDYFFHWLRDSAVVIDALRRLVESGGVDAQEGIAIFRDFLAFSLTLSSLDGRAFLEKAGDYRAKVEPHFLQFLRPEAEILRNRRGQCAGRAALRP